MIQGLLFDHLAQTFRLFSFESPCEAFASKTFTIVGASIEHNLVMIGEDSQDDPEPSIANIDSHILTAFVYDDPPRGDVLFMLTNDKGIPLSIESVHHLETVRAEQKM
jgi:hypothetical protein